MDYGLPASVAHLRAVADAFVEDALTPHVHLLPQAEGPLPGKVAQACADRRRAAGLWGLTVPTADGGRGLTWVEQSLVQERVQRSVLGLWPQGVFAAGEPPTPLYRAQGTQRARYLAPCLSGERQAHQIIVTAASSRGAPGLHIVPTLDGAVLHGTWNAVPAFQAADLLLVVADMAGKTCGFLCQPGMPGYQVTPPRPGMGSIELVDLAWEDCPVAANRILPVIGTAAERWRAQQQVTVLAAGAVGAAEYCLELGLRHVRIRETFGRPLAERQAIQWMLADSARELHAARLLVYRAAALADLGEEAEAVRLAGPTKAYATDAACRIVDRVIQMHGGYGYARDLPMERFWRDLRFYRYAEGDSDGLVAEGAATLVAGLDQ